MANAGKFTGKAQKTLNQAMKYAGDMGHTYIGTEHLLMGLAFDRESISSKMLSAHKIGFNDIKKTVGEICGVGVAGSVCSADMTPAMKRIIEASAAEAANHSNK